MLPELLAYLTHTNTYLLYLVGPPAIGGALLTGAVRRTLRHRSAYYWMAFFVWMLLAAPLSDWKGGSFHRVFDYSRVNILLLFVVYNTVRSERIFFSLNIMYILFALVAPLVYLSFYTLNSKESKQFKNASLMLKCIMLLGLCYSFIYYYN